MKPRIPLTVPSFSVLATILIVIISSTIPSSAFYMSLEDVGRRAIPMLVRANVRNAMKTIKFLRKLNIRKVSEHPATHVYPGHEYKSLPSFFDNRVHHYHHQPPVHRMSPFQPRYAPYASSASFPVHSYVHVPHHHHHGHDGKWHIHVPRHEQQLFQRDVEDYIEKWLDNFPNPIEDLIFRL